MRIMKMRDDEDDEQFNGSAAPETKAMWSLDDDTLLRGLTEAQPDEGAELPQNPQFRIERLPTAEEVPPAQRAPIGKEPTSDKSEGGGFHPNFLAAIAAFTKNPALLQMLQHKQGAAARKQATADHDEDRLYQKNKDAREQGKFELERDLMAPAKAKKLGADADKAGTEAASKELAVGSTKASAEARELVAQRFESTASKYRGSSNEMVRARAGDLERAAKNMRENTSMSGMAAFDAAKLANVDADDIARDAASKYREADGAQDNAETKRWHDAQIGNMSRDDARSAEHNVNVKETAQEKLNAEINDKDQAIQNMGKIAEIKNKVNTGFLTNLWSKWVGEPFDLNSADRNQMNALVARTFNKETKELAGSAVSNAEWERIAPQIPQMKDDDDVFRQKLAAAMEISNEILAKRKQQYQLKGGKPTDSSRTAQRAAAEGNKFADKIESTGAEGVDPEKASKAMRARAAMNSPKATPQQKENAAKWLKANGL